MSEDLRAAVAGGVLAATDLHRALLQSIVDAARAIFNARASSIFLLDDQADELVFEAVSGEGSETLIGKRLPSSTGIAGWVLSTRQPLVLENVAEDPRFSREAAESTGYVPNAMMSVPLLHEDHALGVLNVLDRRGKTFDLAQMDLLGIFATQAAVALELFARAQRAEAAVEGAGDDLGLVARVAAKLDGLPEERRDAWLRLLGDLEELLP
jgi:GAF domain-containing protein